MNIRGGLVLIIALGLGISGCASGGGSTGGGGTSGGGANLLAQGERPRNTSSTRAAERALDDADDADTPEEAQASLREALEQAQAAIAEDSLNPLGYRLAALANLGLKDYAAAGQQFARAIELRPLYELELAPVREQAYIDLYQEATPFLDQGDYSRAAEFLEDADAVYPERPEAMITLAQIYAQQRDDEKALEKIDEAVAFFQSGRLDEVDEATAQNWREQGEGLELMRAQVLAGAGRYEEAVGTYRQIAADEPDNIPVAQDLAAILMQIGNNDEAMTIYNRLLARPDLTPQDYYRIGLGFYQGADYGQAAEAFQRDVQGSSMDRDGIEMWARSLQLDSAFAQVPPVAERWIELDPNSQVAVTVLAQAVNATGDTQRAGEIIGRVDDLPVTVDELQLRRFGEDNVQVSGSVTNKTLDQGAQVTLTFTFYSNSGTQLGTATQRVTVGAADMGQAFQLQYDSPGGTVGGYGYQLMVG